MNPILIPGTGSWAHDGRCDWYCPGHPFGQFLTYQGVAPLYDGDRPFIWSTDLNGVPWLRDRRFVDWAAGGAALNYFVREDLRQPGAATALIAHSHALQVVLFACAEHDLKVDTLISMGSPVRQDMMPVAQRARPNIARWLHVHSDHSDRWQWFGELFDEHVGIVREHPLADVNDFVPKVGHSELLRDPQQYHWWLEKGWLMWLLSTVPA